MGIRKALLSARREYFAREYAKSGNARQAYMHAAKAIGRPCNENSAHSGAAVLLKESSVRQRIHQLRNGPAIVAQLGLQEMVGKLAEAAFADPDELVGIRVGCCRRCYGEGHGYQWREHEYLEAVREAEEAARSLPDIGGGFGFNQTLLPVHGCPECQGEGVERRIPRDTSKLSPGARMLYAGTKRTAQGVDVLLADQGKVRAQLLTLLGHDVKRVQLDGMLTDPVHLLGDLSEATPQEAARRYQEFIAKRG